jgi:hypothetical protein
MKEIFKDIPNYEGLYQVSNLGRVKSLERKTESGRGWLITTKEKILTQSADSNGYYCVGISKYSITKTRTVHQLVAITFLNHKPNGRILVVNHKNFNKQDNRVENLEIVTMRENSNKKHLPSSSKYVGVSWKKENKKWMASIDINGKRKHLGYFNCELEASNAYQQQLNQITL